MEEVKKVICDLCEAKELKKYMSYKYVQGCTACPIADTPEPTKEGLAKLAALADEGARHYKNMAESLEKLQAELSIMAK
jgi:Zn-finger protein